MPPVPRMDLTQESGKVYAQTGTASSISKPAGHLKL